jgi:cell wall-associated NlpC family hydrolase
MRQYMKRLTLLTMISALCLLTACGLMNQARNGERQSAPNRQIGTHGLTPQQGQNPGTAGIKPGSVRAQSAGDAVIPLKNIGTAAYVPMRDLADVLEFRSNWSTALTTLQIGDNDANYEIQINSTRAVKDGEVIQVDRPFLLQGDSVYVPVSALSDLFQEDMSYDIRDGELRIHPSANEVVIYDENGANAGPDQPELNFGEDPADPFKTDTERTVWFNHGVSSESAGDAVQVLQNVNINSVISKAKQYLGVHYLFGAGPYSRTGRFDCSTFTQYVYGKQGVRLPRLARQQANVGVLTSRKNLRKGDLMFFYVPGRFKTNRTVGHVGIYMGNMQMIHSSPKPKNGVQISNINKAYWKRTFVRAKRVAY